MATNSDPDANDLSPVAQASTCPSCSRALSSGAPAGLCTRCLLLRAAMPEGLAATMPLDVSPTAMLRHASLELPQPEALTALLLGGNYQVESFLGRGGMGAVYKGSQVRLRRAVAIKIMRRDQGRDFGFELRFEREAQAMAKLNHPNIVSVIDYGEAGPDYLYIVMELVDGADLMDVIRTGRMTQEMALALLPQICDALQFAHDHGIVHRDIKPSNIMLTRDGRVKMADFGLAKPLGGQESSFHTETGTSMGTPDYAAPEQFKADAPVDHRADIYALGVMIYHMITGEVPRGVWTPPSQRAPIVPEWDDIVAHAMQSDPQHRYQAASEIKTDVSRIAPPGEGGAKAEKSASPPPKPKSRASLAFGVGALVIGLGVFFVLRDGPALSIPDKAPVISNGAIAAATAQPSATPAESDLLASVDAQRDGEKGAWERTTQGVRTTSRTISVLSLRQQPPAEYDFEIEFTIASGDEVSQILPLPKGSVLWKMGKDGGTCIFGSRLEPLTDLTNRTKRPPFKPGQRYRSTVEIRRGSFRALIDGEEVLRWSGDFARFDAERSFSIRNAKAIGVASYVTEVTFHTATLRPIGGVSTVPPSAAP